MLKQSSSLKLSHRDMACGDSMVVKPIGILSDIVQTCEQPIGANIYEVVVGIEHG